MKWTIQVDKSELINSSAAELMKVKELAPPEWSMFVRTGNHKERPPVSENWWYVRAASIMLKTAHVGPIGVSKLRTKYGGKKRRGHKPAEFRRASGNIIRKILQQLETAGLMKQQEKSIHKGRILTPAGFSLLNKVAKGMAKAKKPVKAAPKPDTKKASIKTETDKPAKEAKAPEEKKVPTKTQTKPVKEVKAPEKKPIKEEKASEKKVPGKDEAVKVEPVKEVKPESKPEPAKPEDGPKK